MPHTEYVVKYNESTDLYMTVYAPEYRNCQWGSPQNALTWSSLQDAQTVATLINSGTVGTTKPRN